MRDQYKLRATVRALAILLTFWIFSPSALRAQQSINPALDSDRPGSAALAVRYGDSYTNDKLGSTSGDYKTSSSCNNDPSISQSFGRLVNGTVSNVTVSPNPSPSIITISGIKEANYSIVDMFGRILVSGPLMDNQIDASDFAGGLYLILLTTAEDEVKSVRFTKK